MFDALLPAACLRAQMSHCRRPTQDVRSRHVRLTLSFLLPVCAHAQVSHRRRPNAEWKLKAAGLLGRAQQLVVEATRPVKKVGELASVGCQLRARGGEGQGG